jgi:hypothetical protein
MIGLPARADFAAFQKVESKVDAPSMICVQSCPKTVEEALSSRYVAKYTRPQWCKDHYVFGAGEYTVGEFTPNGFVKELHNVTSVITAPDYKHGVFYSIGNYAWTLTANQFGSKDINKLSELPLCEPMKKFSQEHRQGVCTGSVTYEGLAFDSARERLLLLVVGDDHPTFETLFSFDVKTGKWSQVARLPIDKQQTTYSSPRVCGMAYLASTDRIYILRCRNIADEPKPDPKNRGMFLWSDQGTLGLRLDEVNSDGERVASTDIKGFDKPIPWSEQAPLLIPFGNFLVLQGDSNCPVRIVGRGDSREIPLYERSTTEYMKCHIWLVDPTKAGIVFQKEVDLPELTLVDTGKDLMEEHNSQSRAEQTGKPAK